MYWCPGFLLFQTNVTKATCSHFPCPLFAEFVWEGICSWRWEEITGGKRPWDCPEGKERRRAQHGLRDLVPQEKELGGTGWRGMQESLRKTLAQKVSHPLCLLQQRKWPHLLEMEKEKHSALACGIFRHAETGQARLEHGLWPVARSGNTGVARHRDRNV